MVYDGMDDMYNIGHIKQSLQHNLKVLNSFERPIIFDLFNLSSLRLALSKI